MKRMITPKVHWAGGAALMLLVACGGGSSAAPATVTPARYAYSMPTTLERNDVPLAIMHATAPDGLDPSERGVTFRRALAQGLFELLVNKGFGAAGPYATADEMTFPEKRAVSLLIIPEFNVEMRVAASDVRTSSWSGSSSCTITITPQGSVTLMAIEPLSGQRMWNRRIDVNVEPQVVPGVVDPVWCAGSLDDRPVVGVANAFERIYERLYEQTLAGVDRYVTPEEFTVLNGEVQRLREQTSFGAAR